MSSGDAHLQKHVDVLLRRLGGTQLLEWTPAGLLVELRFPLENWAGRKPGGDQPKP